MNSGIYFDNAATTVVRSEAVNAVIDVMCNDYGNPSGSHAPGQRAAKLLEDARNSVAAALGADAERIVFTSGGTESDNLAIFGTLRNRSLEKRGRHIITSAIEHSAVKMPMKKLEEDGWDVTYLMPDSAGRISAECFGDALRDDTVFASVMLVNNETGTLNPVGEYAAEIRRRSLGTILHTDAVQAFCKVPFSVKSLGAGLISVSSHKLHGPRGAGALYVSEHVRLSPLFHGGAQESGRRAGTEALPAIAGFGVASKLGFEEQNDISARVRQLRSYTIELLGAEIPVAQVIGDGDSPFILCLSLPGYKSEVLLNYLSSERVYVSKGAACKKGARSPTLEAMKLPVSVIDGALRVSFSRYSTREEAERFVSVLRRAAETLVH